MPIFPMDCRVASPYNGMNQFLKINLFLLFFSIYTFLARPFSLTHLALDLSFWLIFLHMNCLTPHPVQFLSCFGSPVSIPMFLPFLSSFFISIIFSKFWNNSNLSFNSLIQHFAGSKLAAHSIHCVLISVIVFFTSKLSFLISDGSFFYNCPWIPRMQYSTQTLQDELQIRNVLSSVCLFLAAAFTGWGAGRVLVALFSFSKSVPRLSNSWLFMYVWWVFCFLIVYTVWGVMMGYRSDSTEIILGRNGKIPSPELFFAR